MRVCFETQTRKGGRPLRADANIAEAAGLWTAAQQGATPIYTAATFDALVACLHAKTAGDSGGVADYYDPVRIAVARAQVQTLLRAQKRT